MHRGLEGPGYARRAKNIVKNFTLYYTTCNHPQFQSRAPVSHRSNFPSSNPQRLCDICDYESMVFVKTFTVYYTTAHCAA